MYKSLRIGFFKNIHFGSIKLQDIDFKIIEIVDCEIAVNVYYVVIIVTMNK
jgi:hypothetical protein